MLNPKPKILVTGGAGSGGSYMLEYLVKCHPSADYTALARNEASLKNKNLEGIKNSIQIEYCDLRDFSATQKAIQKIAPDQIYHFASNANVKLSFQEPVQVVSNNIEATLNLFEACRVSSQKTKILLCSTSEVYGQVLPDEIPIRETNAIRPASPYAV
ncbi:MAG: GDP-mannose 4,6-dehydratase, partial [Pseudobdellovibrio sp.]